MDGLITLIPDARRCADLFRLGRDIEAALVMTDLFERAMPFFAQRPDDDQQQWMQLLSQMLECQEAQNWLALADYLEYEWVEVAGQ